MLYEANGWLKIAEKDNYNDGCNTDSSIHNEGGDRFCAGTLKDLISQLMQFAGTDDYESVLLDSCGEDGRVDIQIMENDEGMTPSKSEMEQFKVGKRDLWLSGYIFHVEVVDRKTIPLSDIKE